MRNIACYILFFLLAYPVSLSAKQTEYGTALKSLGRLQLLAHPGPENAAADQSAADRHPAKWIYRHRQTGAVKG